MRKPTGIRFSDEEYNDLKRYAEQHGTSISDTVRCAVRRFLNPDEGKGYLSLRDISVAADEADLALEFGQFLDNFAHARDKAALIAEEPVWNPESAGRWYYDFAAAAHKLADDSGLPVPTWCLKPDYFPDEPFYAFGTEDAEFRRYLEETTPREFAWHGLFLGPNIMQRA